MRRLLLEGAGRRPPVSRFVLETPLHFAVWCSRTSALPLLHRFLLGRAAGEFGVSLRGLCAYLNPGLGLRRRGRRGLDAVGSA